MADPGFPTGDDVDVIVQLKKLLAERNHPVFFSETRDNPKDKSTMTPLYSVQLQMI